MAAGATGKASSGQTPFLDQVEQPASDLGRSKLFRRLAEMAGEAGDLFDVGSLRQRCEIADPHVLDHAKAKWGHDQLPCETNSATRRRPIVSRLRCQTRGRQGAIAAIRQCDVEKREINSHDSREAG
jgi:hypothetical protein